MLKEILERVASSETVRLVYVVSYDLTGATNEYAAINKALDAAGYSRDSNLGTNTIPKNLFAGEKTHNYYSDQDSEVEFIKNESTRFRDEVSLILENEAPGKFDKIFVMVSKKESTAIRLN